VEESVSLSLIVPDSQDVDPGPWKLKLKTAASTNHLAQFWSGEPGNGGSLDVGDMI
jgi:hypothetical protein